jgi:hypothetical protein
MTAVHAQEEAQPAAADGQAPAAEQQEAPAKIFMPMVRLVQVRGKCDAQNPDLGSYSAAVENKVYPLGTRFRTGPESAATLVFSGQESAQLVSGTEVCVEAPDKQSDNRVLRLFSEPSKPACAKICPRAVSVSVRPRRLQESRRPWRVFTHHRRRHGDPSNRHHHRGGAHRGAPLPHPALRAANTVNIQTSVDRSFSRADQRVG